MFLKPFFRRKFKNHKITEADVAIATHTQKKEVSRKAKHTNNVKISDVSMLEWTHSGSHTREISHFTFWRHVTHKDPIQ